MAAPQEAGRAAIQSVISEQVISEQGLFNWKKRKEQHWHFVLTVATGSAGGSAYDLFGWRHLPCTFFFKCLPFSKLFLVVPFQMILCNLP